MNTKLDQFKQLTPQQQIEHLDSLARQDKEYPVGYLKHIQEVIKDKAVHREYYLTLKRCKNNFDVYMAEHISQMCDSDRDLFFEEMEFVMELYEEHLPEILQDNYTHDLKTEFCLTVDFYEQSGEYLDSCTVILQKENCDDILLVYRTLIENQTVLPVDKASTCILAVEANGPIHYRCLMNPYFKG